MTAGDYVLFLSDNGFGENVGLIEILTDDADTSDRLRVPHDFSDFAYADLLATYWYDDIPSTTGWLLYKDGLNNVPEPGSIAPVELALAGLGAIRRRRA